MAEPIAEAGTEPESPGPNSEWPRCWHHRAGPPVAVPHGRWRVRWKTRTGKLAADSCRGRAPPGRRANTVLRLNGGLRPSSGRWRGFGRRGGSRSTVEAAAAPGAAGAGGLCGGDPVLSALGVPVFRLSKSAPMIAAFTAAGRNAAGSALSAGALATGACWGAAWASCCIISLRFAPSRTTATEMLVPGWRVLGALTSMVWPISASRAIPSLSRAITRASTT